MFQNDELNRLTFSSIEIDNSLKRTGVTRWGSPP
jgi:hypothetical protein